jgi:Xaa-Pro aminopeptidase
MTEARLIIGDSKSSSDLYYRTRFWVGDPVPFFEIDGKTGLVCNNLEIDRAKKDAQVDEVISLAEYMGKAKDAGVETPGYADVMGVLFKERGVSSIQVPSTFPLLHADALRESGFEVAPVKGAFYKERLVKTAEEIEHIAAAQALTEEGMAMAIEMIGASEPNADGVLQLEGETLTAERVRTAVCIFFLQNGYEAPSIIVAGGMQGVDPHDRGSGELRANECIVLDFFPRSLTTGYWGDMTRTVLRGEATDDQLRQYDTVLKAQVEACDMVAPGISGLEVHRHVQQVFDDAGYETGELDGRMQGIFHGTGHGVGLDIHEGPSVGRSDAPLEPGMVVTIEPGLYYAATGGIRIEDIVVVEEGGNRNLNSYPKELVV